MAQTIGDARLRVIDGTETPEGWLGKPHALQQALEASSGEWVLATDADMLFQASALRTAVEYVTAKGCDALTLIPRFEALSFWERVFVPTWLWGGLILFPPELANRPKSRGACSGRPPVWASARATCCWTAVSGPSR